MFGSILILVACVAIAYYYNPTLFAQIATWMLAKCLKFKKMYFDNNSAFTIRGDYICIDYVHFNNNYTIIYPIMLRPRPIVNMQEIVDGTEADIFDDLKKYLGHYGNFHGIPTTPKMLGCVNDIKVTYRNKSVVTYKPDDVISVMCINTDRIVDI